jgi:hypothetical protein
MTRTVWFKPVLATVLAIALGVGAAVVAMRFAPPEVVEVAAPTVEAVVLGGTDPLATGTAEEESIDDSAEEPAGDAPAPTVVVPDPAGLAAEPPAAPVIPEPLAEALAESAAAEDPFLLTEMWALGSALPWVGGFTLDPCVLTPGAAGCPAGSSGVVLDDDLPPLTARIQPRACTPATGTSLSIEITTNTPAESIRVIARSGTLVVEQTVSTSEEWRARWTPGAALAIRHCVETDGWPREALVDITAEVVDIFGRETVVSSTQRVRPSAGAVRPDAQLLGMGVNMMRVSAPFAPGQDVRMGWVDPDAECSYGGDGASTGAAWPAGRWVVDDIPEAYSVDHNWLPEYDRRTTADFVMPTSSSLKLCVGWFEGGEGDVAGRPQYRNEVVVVTPAAALPTATLLSVDTDADSTPGSVSLRAAIPDARCGAWSEADDSLPATLCDIPAVAPWFDAGGYLTVTTEVADAVNHFVIEASATICADGSCPARSEEFDVPILGERPGLCSGTCSDQPRYGTAVVRVDWPASSGAAWWTFGDLRTGAPEGLEGDIPQMRTSAEWTTSSADPGAGTVDAAFPLETDRPVTVRVTLTGDCVRPGVAMTYVNDEMQQWSGAQVRFADLCMGTSYLATVVLTDEQGDVSTTTFGRGDAGWWRYAHFATPATVADLPVQVQLVAPPGSAYALLGSGFTLGSRGTAVSTPGVTVARCFWNTGTVAYRTDGVVIPWQIEATYRVTIAQGELGLSPAVGPDGFSECTGARDADRHTIVVPISMTWDEVFAGAWVEHVDPETGVVVRVRLQPTLFR